MTRDRSFKPQLRSVGAPYPDTLTVTIPRQFAEKLGLFKKCSVQVELEGNAILIRKVPLLPKRKKQTVKE